MLTVIAASSGCVKSAPTSRLCRRIASSAKPNSPPCEITMPVRSALNHWPANGRAASVMIAVLSTRSPASSAMTAEQVPEQRGHVELHADRHEEEPEQRVAERPDAGLDLVAVLGFRQHHAGEEGAEREGEAGGMRRPGGADRDEQHGEGEQLRRAARRDLVEQRPQQPAPRGQHDDERDGGLAEGERDLERRVVVLRRREHAGEREEGHDGQVLEQQDAEGEPPVRAVELVLFGELAEHDRGRGHGDRTAEQDRDGDRQAESPADRGDRGRGRGDLDAAEPEHLAARWRACAAARIRAPA